MFKNEYEVFKTNFVVPITKENFLYIWDGLVAIGLKPDGYLFNMDKYDAHNSMLHDKYTTFEIYINTETRNSYFMLWHRSPDDPGIGCNNIVDTDALMDELPLIKKNIYGVN